MKSKKNPKLDVTKDSSIYFALGLVIVLFVTWQALEWKKYDKHDAFSHTMTIDEAPEEDIPITEHIKTPPPPPPAPVVIEVVKNEEDIKETVIAPTETGLKEDIIAIKDIKIDEVVDDVDVDFKVVEDVPVFPGCESVSKEEQRLCFQQKMQEHVRKNFRYPEIAQELGIQGPVYVLFTIDKDGSITNIRMRGPDKNLEAEAMRIIKKLPQMMPGRQRGIPVRVPFSIPIIFKLN